ncbi:MAG TPA: zinc ribbon domain-containing protein [Thermomicrobiales bacterium]|nr:zinc ribbon domain-containing protein [Thermomicrobiales bacterium]
MSARAIKACPECGGTDFYVEEVAATGAYGPNLLPGIGGFFDKAEFTLYVCGTCGYTRFFVRERFLPQVREKFARYQPEGQPD